MNALASVDDAAMCELTLHRSAFTRVVQSGQPTTRMHVLFTLTASKAPAPFAPLIQLFREWGPRVAPSRQREMAWAVGLFLDFLVAHGHDVTSAPSGALLAFVHALREGTRPGDLLDRAGLAWLALSHTRAARCLALVSEFTDWLANRTGEIAPNAWRETTLAERVVLARRAERRSANALLGHVAMQRRAIDARRTRSVVVRGERNHRPDKTVYAFDNETFERLVRHGFSRRVPDGAAVDRRLRLRDLMVAVLLHGGGLRESEPFHLYVGDVDVDPDRPEVARVRLYHPEDGAAPVEGRRRWRDRAHYLCERWNLEPRSRVHGRFHAGWKALALTDQRQRFAEVFWFPERWGQIFLRLYRAYLRVRPSSNHPFLFVSEARAHRGEPYTIAAFEQAHARAVRRIGLVPAKHRGTTPHSHRHAYGLALADAGVDRLYRQRALHHRSPESQNVYTAPDTSAVNRALSVASLRVWGDAPNLPQPLESNDEP